MSRARQFCTFHLDRLFLGVEVEKVQEVIRYQEMTRVPLAAEVIRGLINLRGRIVTAIDLRRRLLLSPRDERARPMNVVLRTDDGAVSLLVDEIGDVIEVEDQAYERAPDNVRAPARDLIRGVYKLKDKLLLVLDTEKTVSLNASVSDGEHVAPAAV
ncbi:MAG: chemotaxis protein CheW [Planctomycetota bacterium]